MLIHSCLSNFMRLFAPVVIFLATFTWAQVKVQGSSSVYEGQKVDAVDLAGNPHRDPELLRPLVVQKAGEPYSQTKVEASVQALQEAGGFPKVTVNVVPDLSGVRVSFLLEPVYYPVSYTHLDVYKRQAMHCELWQSQNCRQLRIVECSLSVDRSCHRSS